MRRFNSTRPASSSTARATLIRFLAQTRHNTETERSAASQVVMSTAIDLSQRIAENADLTEVVHNMPSEPDALDKLVALKATLWLSAAFRMIENQYYQQIHGWVGIIMLFLELGI